MNLSTARRVALLLLACLGAGAHAAATPETTKVSRLIDASGISHVARQLQPVMVSAFDAPLKGVPDNVRLGLKDAASQSFQSGPVIEKVRGRLSAMTPGQLDEALAWLDAPLGRKITQAENEAAEPAAMSRIEAYGGELKKRPSSKSRSDLLARLAVATGSAEFNSNLIESTTLATALGINAAQPKQNQMATDLIRKHIKTALPNLVKQSEQQTSLAMQYTYRDISDRELEAYLKFLRSPGGSAYTKAAVAGLIEAMNEALGRYMQAIPPSLAKRGHSVGT